MAAPRVIVSLSISDGGLYRTRKFKDPCYVGDPLNAIRIFNEKEVDEMVLVDISQDRTLSDEKINFFSKLASQAFMPIAYGGGITSIEQMRILFKVGFDKVIVNSASVSDSSLLKKASSIFGAQSIVASIDYRRKTFGGYQVVTRLGQVKTNINPVDHAVACVKQNIGEIYLRSVDHDGLMDGYHLDILKKVAERVGIPIVISGGAGNVSHFIEAKEAGAQSVCASSMFVFHGPKRAVLINYPRASELDTALDRVW